MKLISKIAWVHVMLAIGGGVLCAFGKEGPGGLVLCVSAMCLMVVKADDLIAPDARDELADISFELGKQREIANVSYRRAMTLSSVLDGRREELGGHARQLAEILRRLDSDESSVDAEILKLRDSVFVLVASDDASGTLS